MLLASAATAACSGGDEPADGESNSARGPDTAVTAQQPKNYEIFQLTPDQEERRYSRDLLPCIDRAAGSDAHVSACYDHEFDRQDAALNAAYWRAMGRLGVADRERLRNQQHAWLQTRYDHCDRHMREGMGDAAPGTLDMLAMDDCFLSEIIRRMAWLESYR